MIGQVARLSEIRIRRAVGGCERVNTRNEGQRKGGEETNAEEHNEC